MADAPDNMAEAVALLQSQGYTANVTLHGDHVHCAECGESYAADDIEVDVAYRFEGDSDPADESIVLGLRCGCGAKGVLVSAYGPDADPGLAQAFSYLAAKARPA